MEIEIQRAQPGDLADLLALLEASGLPQAGLSDRVATALVARDNLRVVGCAALELYGSAALLRSVAVVPALHRRQLGDRLVRSALDLARQRGVATVYLLTETAAGFFRRFGFQPIQRAEVVPAIQQSIEFTSACPASAQAMRLVLEPRARGDARGCRDNRPDLQPGH